MTARKPLLEALVSMLAPDDVVVSCLGANSRYLPHLAVPVPVFALCDSMGAAIPLALGMALERPARHVVATVAACRPSNLTVILWVNGHYESSGGQSLPSAPVDWPVLARGLGIAHVQRVGDVAGLRAAFPRARAAREPALLVLDVAFDRAEPIPPYSERPDEIRARFKIA